MKAFSIFVIFISLSFIVKAEDVSPEVLVANFGHIAGVNVNKLLHCQGNYVVALGEGVRIVLKDGKIVHGQASLRQEPIKIYPPVYELVVNDETVRCQ